MTNNNLTTPTRRLYAVDLFCGVGGLTLGLQQAGVDVIAGVDSDPSCAYPYTWNTKAAFLELDISNVTGSNLAKLYPQGATRLLAGCAPCKPFSSLRRRAHAGDADWSLLKQFSRIARELQPELLTMENVPRLASKAIFEQFIAELKEVGYVTDWNSVYCPRFGVPQRRRRLVLVASKIGPVAVPTGPMTPDKYQTVRKTIGNLLPLEAGTFDPEDPLHWARSVSPRNLSRLRASRAGGTWLDWPEDLRSACHKKASGASFRSVYSRMSWDEPSPTITTQSYNFGTGRFGHPDQDRSITLREAALLQTFPQDFKFVETTNEISMQTIGRLIGNAVPPKLAFHIGNELLRVTNRAA